MNLEGLPEKIFDYIAKREAEKKKKAMQSTEVLADLEKRFNPVDWLTNAARRAKQIQLSTHVLKFIHTAAEGNSLNASKGEICPEDLIKSGVVSTASLSKPDLDFVCTAGALDVVGLLLIEHEGKALIDFIRKGDMSPLSSFAVSKEQLDEWQKEFMKMDIAEEPASHTLSKQVYFPLGNGEYHLLSPLYASSFAHEIYKHVRNARYSDQSKLARQAKKESKYSSARVIDYPNIAVQTYGGTKPQNVSHLNSTRRGKIFLLNCAPPSWKSRFKPPLHIKSIFSRNHFEYRVRKDIAELRKYLQNQSKKRSVKSVRDHRAEMIDSLIDQLIRYGTEIQNLQDDRGWSALPECKLSPPQCLWLDPCRADLEEAFDQERKKNDWKESIAKEFATWLNHKLEDKELHFGDAEHREWKSVLEQKLLLHKDYLEVFS